MAFCCLRKGAKLVCSCFVDLSLFDTSWQTHRCLSLASASLEASGDQIVFDRYSTLPLVEIVVPSEDMALGYCGSVATTSDISESPCSITINCQLYRHTF